MSWAVVNESYFSFLFCAKKNNSPGKKSVCKCCEETRLALFSVPTEKFPNYFETVRQSYLTSLYHMCAQYLLHLSHAISDLSLACNKCDIEFVAWIFYIYLMPWLPAMA